MTKVKKGVNALSKQDLELINQMATLSFYPYMSDAELEKELPKISGDYTIILDTKEVPEIYQHGRFRCLVLEKKDTGDIIFTSSGTRLNLSWELYADFLDVIKHLSTCYTHLIPSKCKGMDHLIDCFLAEHSLEFFTGKSIYFAGHSLGALSSVTGVNQFRAKVLEKYNEDVFEQVRAISFESPGCENTFGSLYKTGALGGHEPLEFWHETSKKHDIVCNNRESWVNSTQPKMGKHIEIGENYSDYWSEAICSGVVASGLSCIFSSPWVIAGTLAINAAHKISCQFEEHRIKSMQQPLQEEIALFEEILQKHRISSMSISNQEERFKELFSTQVMKELLQFVECAEEVNIQQNENLSKKYYFDVSFAQDREEEGREMGIFEIEINDENTPTPRNGDMGNSPLIACGHQAYSKTSNLEQFGVSDAYASSVDSVHSIGEIPVGSQ